MHLPRYFLIVTFRGCLLAVVSGGALIAALALDGDRAAGDVCDALGKLTGRELPYDRNASVDTKRKIIAGWQEWWAAVRKNHR